jgi:hypothetical protein
MCICRINNEWIGQQTFRYNVGDGDPFMDKDNKSITMIHPKSEMSEEEIIKTIDELFEFIKLKYNDFSYRFLVQGNGEKFMEICKTKEYMHIKMVH